MSQQHRRNKNGEANRAKVGVGDQDKNKDMFYSHCLLSRKGPLGSIWVAAYCYNKLRKTQVTSTDIPSSVDKILEDESDLITYRILAFVLLGIVRIYSKKVEYLFDDCNKVLLNIKDFVLKNKDGALMEAPCAPYFSITLPERFELDTFDLEIVEDTSCSNVVSLEEITLKENKWKSGGGFRKCFADQYGYEDFASSSGTFSGGYVLNEIGLSSHEMDFEMEQAISKIQASTEKLHYRVSQHGYVDVRTSSAVEDGHPGPSKSFGEEHETVRENAEVPKFVDMGEMHAETSKQKSQDDIVSKVACASLETFGGAQEETMNPQYGEIYQNDRHQKKDPGVMRSESELQDVIEDRDLGDVNAVIEKLLDVSFSQEEHMDIQMPCAIREALENARPLNEDCQTGDEISLSWNSHCHAKEDEGIPVKLDATPQTKVHDGPAAAAPELFFITTPTTKERARNQRKRKCFFDDVIVFPNKDSTYADAPIAGAPRPILELVETFVIKQIIADSSDLVCRRRKAPHTALAAWKEHRLSSVSRCFLEPLIPSASLDLSTFLCEKNANTKESVKTLEVPRRLVSEFPSAGEKSNVSESPTVARIVEGVRPPEQVDMLIPESISTIEVPQEYVYECSNVDRFVETVEHQEKSHIPESLVGGRKVTLGPLETLRASDSATVSRFVETVGPPGELDIPKSPAAAGVEQGEIAPETPIRHTSYPRSFESPDGPDMSYVDGDVDKSPCLYKDQELDFCLLNEETNACEEDEIDHYGWSERTRVAMSCLHRSFLICKEKGVNEIIDLSQLLEGRTAKESARLFSEILVLKSKGYVHVKQENAYSRLIVWKTSQWDRAFGEACK